MARLLLLNHISILPTTMANLYIFNVELRWMKDVARTHLLSLNIVLVFSGQFRSIYQMMEKALHPTGIIIVLRHFGIAMNLRAISPLTLLPVLIIITMSQINTNMLPKWTSYIILSLRDSIRVSFLIFTKQRIRLIRIRSISLCMICKGGR